MDPQNLNLISVCDMHFLSVFQLHMLVIVLAHLHTVNCKWTLNPLSFVFNNKVVNRSGAF